MAVPRGLPLVWLAVFGCETRGTREDSNCPAQQTTLKPGMGDAAFLPLSDGDLLSIEHGPQGGWHAALAGEVEGAGPEIEVHATLMKSGEGGLPLSGQQPPSWLALERYDDARCSGVFTGMHALIDPQPGIAALHLACALDGASLSLSLSLIDGRSGLATDASLALTGALDPETLASCL